MKGPVHACSSSGRRRRLETVGSAFWFTVGHRESILLRNHREYMQCRNPLMPPDNRMSAFAAGRQMTTALRKSRFQEKKNSQVPGRSLAAKSDFIIKGMKNISLRWLTLCSAVIGGFRGRLPRQTGRLHNVHCQPG